MMKYRKVILLFSILQQLYVQGWAQEIKINERIPDIFIPEVFRYKKSKINLRSEFEGKPLIIDFWFTYCASCIGSMPKLDSLQRKHNGKINILLSTFEKREVTERFLTNKKVLQNVSLPTIISDTLLLKVFPHITSPHEIWIDKNGIVVAITGHEEITEENITKLINGEALHLPVKSDIKKSIPAPVQLSLESNKTSQYSYFDGYQEKSGGEIHRGIKNGFTKIKTINLTFQMLYELAYEQDNLKPSQYNYKNIDPKSYIPDDKTGDNLYCYEMKLKDTIWNNVYQYMRQDLDRYFKINSELKNEPTLCYIISKAEALQYNDTTNINGFSDWYKEGDNYILQYAPWQAVIVYLNQTLSYPLIDETGNNLKTKIKLLAIPLDLTNLKEANNKLARYNLKLEQKLRNVNHIVFSNNNNNNYVTKH